jgi:hypothetical protein
MTRQSSRTIRRHDVNTTGMPTALDLLGINPTTA